MTSIFKDLNIFKFIFFSFLLSNFVPQLVISDEKLSKDNLINWEKLNKTFESKKIKWEIINEYLIPLPTTNLNNYKKLTFEERFNLSKPEKNNQLYSGPFIFSNSFLKKGYFSHELKQKSSFSGGDARGSGNQIYSYTLNYAFGDKSIISGVISESDDPLFNSILNKPIKDNFWRNYAIILNKKLFSNKKNNLNISLNSSLEYWELNSYYRQADNSVVYGEDSKILGSLALPLTKKYKKMYFLLSPRISFIPNKIGVSPENNNFYGNNYSLSSGLGLDIFPNTSLGATYTFLYGNSKNTFDDDLKFSKNNIYSYGINWKPNSIVNLRLGITNSFGATPATSLLTIPSANLDLYEFQITIRPDHRDTIIPPVAAQKKYLYQSGLTVNNALIPRRGSNELFASYDGSKSLFGFYGFSISNIFQIEVANLARIRNNKIYNNTKTNETIKNTFFSEDNLNNRFGGTLNLFSPDKGDWFWMSLRTTLGRDQKSDQGYLFTEILNTFQINNKMTLNISPKYAWSGIQSTGGAGLSIVFKINEKFSFSPEMNINLRDIKDTNNSFIFKYLIDEKKSLDLFITNALGIQDMSQLIKSKENKFGIRYNILF